MYIERQHNPIWPSDPPPCQDTRSDFRPPFSNGYPPEAEVQSNSPGLEGSSLTQELSVGTHPVSLPAPSSSYYPIDSFRWQGAHVERQCRTSQIRSEPVRQKRFQPYSPNNARTHEGSNAGHYMTSLPPRTLKHLGPPTGQPSGVQTKTTADTDTQRTKRRGNKALVSNFYHFHSPRASDCWFGVRSRKVVRV